MRQEVRLLLYLYAAFGDPAESSYVLIVGGKRPSDEFYVKVLPFVFNLFAVQMGQHGQHNPQGYLTSCYQYIAEMQRRYLQHLKTHIGKDVPDFSIQEDTVIDIPALVERHRISTQWDETCVKTPTVREISQAVKFYEVPINSGQGQALLTALENARDSFDDLVTFNRLCMKKNIDKFLAPEQVMGEFMSFLTHFSRAYFDKIHQTEGSNPTSDLGAGILHVVRAVLDMRNWAIRFTQVTPAYCV